MILAQINYLTQTYLRQVYLISEIQLLRNLEEIKIKTILNDRLSIFGKKSNNSNSTDGEIIVKIADVHFSDKDKPSSPIMRIMAGDKRYYMHKNMSVV